MCCFGSGKPAELLRWLLLPLEADLPTIQIACLAKLSIKELFPPGLLLPLEASQRTEMGTMKS